MTKPQLDRPAIAAQFARNLVRSREHADLSQAEVAQRADLEPTHVSILEHAGRIPQIDTVIRLAGAIGTEPGELLRGMTWRPSQRREGTLVNELSAAEQLGRNLHRLRRKAGLAQEELALRASLHHTTVGAIEAGRTNARMSTLEKLAQGLGAQVAELLEGTGREHEAR